MFVPRVDLLVHKNNKRVTLSLKDWRGGASLCDIVIGDGMGARTVRTGRVLQRCFFGGERMWVWMCTYYWSIVVNFVRFVDMLGGMEGDKGV